MTPDERRTSPRAHIACTAALMGLAASALLAMGRSPWCRCGVIRLWSGNTWGPENSQQLTDPYTFTHVTHGFLLYGLLALVARGLPLRTRAVLAIAAESAWEVFENTDMVVERYRAATMALGYYGDSIFNSMGDILACAAGVLLASRLSVRSTVLIAVVLELGLTLWIRDSLLLNVVMLAYPVDAVKTWQLGASP